MLKPWQLVLLIAVASFALTLLELPAATWPTSAAFSLGSGVAALSMMATAAVLASRWSWVESALGGLDRVYLAHKWLGVWALALASYHLVFKAGLDTWDTAPIVEVGRYWMRLVRQLSFVALMFIVLLALNRKIPYNVWRWWHKLSGPLFLIVIGHWLTFPSPIRLASPAGGWLAALSTLGVVAAAWKLLLYPRFAPHGEYRVTHFSPGAQAVHLTLEPVRNAIAFRPGQFGFLRLKEDGLREPHPFTIASGNTPDGKVEFVVRALGDFTHRLVAGCTVGMHADIYAPYGRFQRPSEARREVWIGGGVGISPFIAWLRDARPEDLEKVTLFYFLTPGRDFPSVESIAKLARERGAELVAVPRGAADAAFVERFDELAAADPKGLKISFCGPRGLLDAVRERMRGRGIPEANLQYEHFEFR